MNDHQRRQHALATQRRQFAQAVATGSLQALDRFGNPLTPGAKVLYHPSADLIFEVIGVAPELDPRAPAGLLVVTLSAQASLHLPAQQPALSLILMAAEAPKMAIPAGSDGGRPHGEETSEETSLSGGSPPDPAAPPTPGPGPSLVVVTGQPDAETPEEPADPRPEPPDPDEEDPPTEC